MSIQPQAPPPPFFSSSKYILTSFSCLEALGTPRVATMEDAMPLLRQIEAGDYSAVNQPPREPRRSSTNDTVSSTSSHHSTARCSSSGTRSAPSAPASSSTHQCRSCGKLFESKTRRDEHRSRRGH